MLKVTASMAALTASTRVMCLAWVCFTATHPTMHCVAGITNLSILGASLVPSDVRVTSVANVPIFINILTSRTFEWNGWKNKADICPVLQLVEALVIDHFHIVQTVQLTECQLKVVCVYLSAANLLKQQ